MYAVVITEPGEPDVLHWTEVPDIAPGPGEVLIEVAAAGVNHADLLQRQGLYDPPPGASPYPGLECSGTVVQVGDGVTRWKAGDEACALLAGGAYASHVAVPEGQLLPVPATVSLTDAAALPETACTVYSNVFLSARLSAGETFLVHGGSSGIGTMAIQLGKNAGATVAVTAGTQEKLDSCRGLGADILIMGASYLARNVDALASDGRLTIIGLQGGRKAELNLGTLMAKRGSVISTSLRARPKEQKTAIVAAVREHVWPLVDNGTIRPMIHQKLPMAEAAEAHRVMMASTHTGKILLTAQ